MLVPVDLTDVCHPRESLASVLMRCFQIEHFGSGWLLAEPGLPQIYGGFHRGDSQGVQDSVPLHVSMWVRHDHEVMLRTVG